MKHLIIIFSCIWLGACATYGESTSKPILDGDDEPVKSYGVTLKEKSKKSKSAAVTQTLPTSIDKASEIEQKGCYLPPESLSKLQKEEKDTYFNSDALKNCLLVQEMTNLIKASKDNPTSVAGEVSREYANMVTSIEKGDASRHNTFWRGFWNTVTFGFGTYNARKGIETVAENSGGIEVGSISAGGNGGGEGAGGSPSIIVGKGNTTSQAFPGSTINNNQNSKIQTASEINDRDGLTFGFE